MERCAGNMRRASEASVLGMFLHCLSRASFTYLDLFKTPEMRRISFLIILLWMIISCVFDTTVRLITNLKFEFYYSFMIAASMELPADLCSIVGINWLGRRWSASISLLFTGLTMVVCAFTAGMLHKSFKTKFR